MTPIEQMRAMVRPQVARQERHGHLLDVWRQYDPDPPAEYIAELLAVYDADIIERTIVEIGERVWLDRYRGRDLGSLLRNRRQATELREEVAP